jgi:4-amino-4-deoxy-L-arabinose transferase-like glycosyltransferase
MRNYLLLAAIVLAGIIPFSSRAVFLDEHIFLHVAQTAAHANLLFPQDTPWVFFGTRVPNLAAHTHPPVGEYYLALLYSIFGQFREVPFRLAFSVFAIAAVLAFYDLARRFTLHPFLLALIFAFSPAFFIYSPTLMMDVPMLSFLLVGLASYFRGHLVPAAACFILAAGTGYTALVPLFCIFIAQVVARRPLREILTVCAAPIALSLWMVAISIHFGEFPLARTVHYYATQGSRSRNIVAFLSFLGSVIIFPWMVRATTRRGIAIAVAAATAITFLATWPSLAYRAWYVFLASSGLLILSTFVMQARRLIAGGKNQGEAILILWVPSVLLFFIVIGDMVNARYVVLVIAPLLLVLFAEADARRLIYTLLPTAALALTLAYADFSFVNLNRDLAERNIVPLQRQGFHVWSAAESGLRFYLEENGAATLASQDVNPGPGDLIVRHQGLFGYSLADAIAVRITTLKTFSMSNSFPVRIYSVSAGAGFHDSGAGLVPFTLSSKPYDAVELLEVSPLGSAAVWSPKGPIYVQTEPEREFSVKVPSNTNIEYDVDGDGAAAVYADRIRLIKGSSPQITWRNFRIVPAHW